MRQNPSGGYSTYNKMCENVFCVASTNKLSLLNRNTDAHGRRGNHGECHPTGKERETHEEGDILGSALTFFT